MATAPQDLLEFAADMERQSSAFPGSLDEALRECIPVVRQGVRDNYDTASTAGGLAWPPHAPSTIRRYGPHPLLILSGAMQEASLEGSGHVERVEDGELQFGLSLDAIPYGRVHQEGYPPGNIPQREYLAMSEEVVEECKQIVALHAHERAS